MDLVVGFDLDMTLVDPRPGVRVALRALGLDEFLAESLGSPLEEWLPAGTDLDLYRGTCLNTAHLTLALPGAAQALDAVRSYGRKSPRGHREAAGPCDRMPDRGGIGRRRTPRLAVGRDEGRRARRRWRHRLSR
jgi:hypothetical protein